MKLILFFVGLLFAAQSRGQDPSFSQIENTRTYSHPSLFSLRQGIELQMAHRIQWNNLYGDFQTTFISAFLQGERIKSGFGVSMLQDQEGDGKLKTQIFNFNYRYTLLGGFYIPRSLVVSLYGGITKKSVDWNKLFFSDQIDPVLGIYKSTQQSFPSYQNKATPNIGFGFTYKQQIKIAEKKYPVSLSFDLRHTNLFVREDESILGLHSLLPTLKILTISTVVQPEEYYGLPLFKPVLRFESQKDLKKIQFGSLIGLAKDEQTIYTGLYYSQQYSPVNYYNTNSVIILLGFEKAFNSTLYSFGYSYDLNLSGFGNQRSGGTHEITLSIVFNTGKKSFPQPSNIFDKCKSPGKD